MNKASDRAGCRKRASTHRRTRFFHTVLLSLALALPTAARGQLVSDGQTNILDNIATNLTGGITIGTNGSFTLLVITNGSTVTNSGGLSAIGYNASARTNRMVVTGSGSVFNSDSYLYVGLGGSGNEMDILDGGWVISGGSVGQGSASSNNLVLLTFA
jgi:T5SS/PEP-CTERM-associated repeat protein